MSIDVFEEEFGGRAGSIDHIRQRRYTRVFNVETTSPYVGFVAIRLDGRCPTIGSTYNNGYSPTSDPLYEFDHGSFCNEITAETDGIGTAWRVTAKYEPFDPSLFVADPTLWPLRVQFGGERTERVVDFDFNGTPIRNSAGDRFGDPVTVDDHITTLNITRNEKVSSFDINLANQYSDTVNNGAWNGIPARGVKMGIISTSEEKYADDGAGNGIWYYTVTYPVSINRDLWNKKLLDQGYNELGPYYGAPPKPIMNGGQPISEPVALNGAGNRLATGGTPVTLTFYPFKEVDWAGLGINLSVRLGL